LQKDLTFYFWLFLVQCGDGKDMTVIRRLQKFEAPYVSLQRANNPNIKIQVHQFAPFY